MKNYRIHLLLFPSYWSFGVPIGLFCSHDWRGVLHCIAAFATHRSLAQWLMCDIFTFDLATAFESILFPHSLANHCLLNTPVTRPPFPPLRYSLSSLPISICFLFELHIHIIYKKMRKIADLSPPLVLQPQCRPQCLHKLPERCKFAREGWKGQEGQLSTWMSWRIVRYVLPSPHLV